MLQDAGTDGLLHFVPAAGFDVDGTDPVAMQQMRQEQPGWAGTDDSNLRAHS
jgi:hypothetical protein